MAELTALFEWMQDQLLGAVDDPEAVAATFRSTPGWSAAARLGQYRSMIRYRLIEVLVEDFPALHAVLGGEAFWTLARAYLRAFPPVDHSLAALGAQLPRFLADTEPGRPALFELARLERALIDVFHAPREPGLAPEGIAALAPEQWAVRRLGFRACVRLFAFDHRLEPWLSAARSGGPLPPLEAGRSYMLVYRPGLTVKRCDLARAQYTLLEALAAGFPLGAALMRCAALPGTDPARLLAEVGGWFQRWAKVGVFRGED